MNKKDAMSQKVLDYNSKLLSAVCILETCLAQVPDGNPGYESALDHAIDLIEYSYINGDDND